MLPLKTSIVKLDLRDLDRCIILDQLTLHGIWNRKQWIQELTNPSRISIGLISKSKLIGFSFGWIVLNELHITLVAIHPSYQRKGLARLMVSEFLEIAKMKNIKTTVLEIKENNYAAKALYTSLNFKEINTRLNLYKDGSNALIFKLDF